MALNVTGTFEQPTGQSLDAAYARTNAALNLQGDMVMAYPDFWVRRSCIQLQVKIT